MATGYLHAAYESVPGNETNSPTLSTKVLYMPVLSFTPRLGAAPLSRDDEVRNVDEPLMVIPESYSPDWELDVRMYPDTLGFLLKLLLGNPTTTAGNGVITDPDAVAVPVGAHRHVWTAPFGPAGASPLTAQFQPSYRDQSTFFKMKGAACSRLSIETPESGGARLRASGPALFMQRQADPSLTPSYEALTVQPFERGNLQLVTWLASTATTEDFSVTLDNPVEPWRSLGIASDFPDIVEKADGPITVSGSIPKRQLDPDDYDALLNATGFGTKARWTSDSIIAASYPYKFWIEHDNAQYVAGGPAALENRRRLGASFDFKGTYDGVGASTTITLVNATSSYA